MASAQEPGSIQPWHAAYPPPKNAQPASLTREELLQMMKAADSVAKRDFVLVDLRRTDLVVSFFLLPVRRDRSRPPRHSVLTEMEDR